MTVVTRHWTRTMAMEAWSKGTERSLVRILSPQKERGTATLMVGNDLFTYLSKTDRTVKISGGMMGGSWMGVISPTTISSAPPASPTTTRPA